MSMKSNLLKAAGLGVVATALTAGAAFAAVATTSANVRSGPGTGYGVVDTLAPGEYVSITGQAGSWCRVSKPGPDGYVACYLLTGSYRGPVRPPVYVRPPSFGFSVGPGGFGVHVGPDYPYHPRMHRRPWWY